jgi:hypothetical protein
MLLSHSGSGSGSGGGGGSGGGKGEQADSQRADAALARVMAWSRELSERQVSKWASMWCDKYDEMKCRLLFTVFFMAFLPFRLDDTHQTPGSHQLKRLIFFRHTKIGACGDAGVCRCTEEAGVRKF